MEQQAVQQRRQPCHNRHALGGAWRRGLTRPCASRAGTPGCHSTTVDAVQHMQPNSARQLCLLQPRRESGSAARARCERSHTPVLLAPTLPFSRARAWRQLLSACPESQQKPGHAQSRLPPQVPPSAARSSAAIWLAGGRSAGSAARHAPSSAASAGGHAAGGARPAPTSCLRKRMSPSLRPAYGACDMPAHRQEPQQHRFSLAVVKAVSMPPLRTAKKCSAAQRLPGRRAQPLDLQANGAPGRGAALAPEPSVEARHGEEAGARLRGQHIPQQHAERVAIARRAAYAALQQLGRLVCQRAAPQLPGLDARRWGHVRAPKVGYLSRKASQLRGQRRGMARARLLPRGSSWPASSWATQPTGQATI